MRPYILLFSLFLTGCPVLGTVVGALPTIIQLVQDAVLILDQIDGTARPFFEMQENKELLQQYNSKMFAAKKALQAALRASEGGKQLEEKDVDAAFDSFRDAYKDLLAFLREANLMTESGTFKVAPGSVNIDVEVPLAVSRRR